MSYLELTIKATEGDLNQLRTVRDELAALLKKPPVMALGGTGLKQLQADAAGTRKQLDLMHASLTEVALAVKKLSAPELSAHFAKSQKEIRSTDLALRSLTDAEMGNISAVQAQAAVFGIANREHKKYISILASQAAASDITVRAIRDRTAALLAEGNAARIRVSGLLADYQLEKGLEAQRTESAVAGARLRAEARAKELSLLRAQSLSVIADYQLEKGLEAQRTAAVQAGAAQRIAARRAELLATVGVSSKGVSGVAGADLSLSAGLEAQRRAAIAAGAAMRTAAIGNTAYGKSAATASAASKDLHAALRGVGGATGSLWLTYSQSLLPMMAAFVTVATSIKGLKIAADFEYATKFAHTLAVATGDASISLENLRARLMGIKDVAHTPGELAGATKELVKAGFDAATSVGEMATMSKMASVAEEDLAVITKTVASQYRAWNSEAIGTTRGVKDLTQVANAMTFTAMKAALDVGELGQMLKYTGVLASQSGISFDELLASLGHLSNVGVRGTTAATALRTAIMKLQNPTEKTTRDLRELGLSFDFIDKDTGKLKSLVGLFSSLQVTLKGLADKERVKIIGDLFSLRSMAAGPELIQSINKAVVSGQLSVEEFSKAIKKAREESTFLNTVWAELSETTLKQAEMLKSDVARELGQAFAGSGMKDLVKELREAVNSGVLRELINGLATAVKLTIEFRDVLLELGTLWVFSKLARGFLALEGAILAVTTAQWGLNAAMLANPVGIATVALYSAYKLGNYIWDRVNATRAENAEVNTLLGAVHKLKTDVADIKPVKVIDPNDPFYKALAGEQAGTGPAVPNALAGTHSGSSSPSAGGTSGVPRSVAAYNAVHGPAVAAKLAAQTEEIYGLGLDRQLEDLKASNTDKLIAVEEYHSAVSEIEKKRSAKHLATLEAEVAAAQAAYAAAGKEADLESPGDPKDALAKLDTAYEAVLAAQHKVNVEKKKQENRENADQKAAGSRRLATDKLLFDQELALSKNSSARLLQERQGALGREGELLDAYRSRYLVSEDAYWDKSREIQAQGMKDQLSDLEAQLGSAEKALERTKKEFELTGRVADRSAFFQASEEVEVLKAKIKELIAELENYQRVSKVLKKDASDWVGGAKEGILAYGDSIASAFELAKSATVRAFESMEDALVNFVRGGKLSFSDMVDSMINDLARLVVRQNLMQPLIAALSPSLTSAGTSGGGVSSLASGLVGLAGAAQLGSMAAGYTSPTASAVTAGVGLAGVGLEAYNGTVGATSAALQQGVARVAASIGLGTVQGLQSGITASWSSAASTVGFDAVTVSMEAAATEAAASSGLAGQISSLSSAAFAGWSAGIGTFVIGLLRGQSFQDAAVQGVGAGFGAWAGFKAGAAIGSYFPVIGTAIGAAIGTILGSVAGSWLGSLFGSGGENTFTLGELVQPGVVVDTIFEKTEGLRNTNWAHAGGGNSWYQPVANAYSDMVGVINESFTDNVFAFADSMPDMLGDLFLDKIAATDYTSLLSAASGGRWGLSGASGALEGVATSYAAALAKAAEGAYAAAIADFFATAAPSEMLGPELAGTWDILTDRAQAYVKSLFVKAGEAVTSGGLEAGLTEAGKIAENMQALQDSLAPIFEIIDTKDMTEQELALRAVNKQFADYATALESAGVDMAKFPQFAEALSISLDKAAESTSNLTEKAQEYADAVTAAEDSLRQAYERESAAFQDTIDKFTAFGEALRKFKQSLLIGDLSTLSPLEKYDEAKRQFESVANRAKLGDADAIEQLQGVSQSFLEASRGYYASTESYGADFSAVSAVLDATAAVADRTASIAQKELDKLDLQVSALITVNESVLSVRDAIIALNLAKDAPAADATAAERAGTIRSYVDASIAQGGYNAATGVNILQRAIDVGVSSAELAAAVSGTQGWTQSEILAFAQSQGLPAFADGGSHYGGLRVVGERGWEVEATGPARIWNQDQLGRAMKGGGGLDAEDKQLLREILTELRADKTQRGAAATAQISRLEMLADKLDGTNREIRRSAAG